MKIFAFVDLHENKRAWEKVEEKVRKGKPDLILCAGDITIFENDIEDQVKKLSKIGPKVLLVHGNHENPEIMLVLSQLFGNIEFIHLSTYRVDNYVFLGYGGDGFSVVDKDFEKFVKKVKKDLKENDRLVLMTHGPPFGTELDLIGTDHIGNKSYKKFIEKNNVILAVSGHLHENAKKEEYLNKKRLINPGPTGKMIEI